MIRKTAKKQDLDNISEIRQNLQYWLSRPTEERLAAVDALRREYYGDSQRLQRIARVVLRQESTGQQAQGRRE